jgi:hypothetical protein
VKNVTISMDEDLARWVRVEAAKADTSVSRWIGEVLEDLRTTAAEAPGDDLEPSRLSYEAAYRAWKSRIPTMLKQPGDRYPTRDELHER